jgi:uncharacterized membrane protein
MPTQDLTPGTTTPARRPMQSRAPQTLERRGDVAPTRRAEDEQPTRLARPLGWFSIGLGVAQMTAPRSVARVIGARGNDMQCTVMRALGLREFASGLGILRGRRASPWLWSRVVGDAMDLALLGSVFTARRTDQSRVAVAAAAVAGVTALDIIAARRSARMPARTKRRRLEERGIRVIEAVTIDAAPEELYRRWRDLANLPRLLSHLESVEVIDEQRSRWSAKGPAGTTIEWEAEITEDRPNKLIAWRSLPGADVTNAGEISFRRAPGGRGTEIRVELRYDPPAGRLGAVVAKLFGREPGQEVVRDLRRFKQIVEVGEPTHSDASIHHGPHAARPVDAATRAKLLPGTDGKGGVR